MMGDTITEEQSYYDRLKHYKPMCYSGKGVPFLMVHDTYFNSIPCIIFINVVFVLVAILTHFSAKNSKDQEFKNMLVKFYVLALVLINLSYFLTVFMNPGIVSEKDLDISSYQNTKFCESCSRKTVQMTHCRTCQVCVEDLDHHCGFFGKCIAGGQRFAFYGFILFMFLGFVLILVGVSSNLQ